MKKYILFILVSCAYVNAYAQDENWDTYMAEIAKRPASILVDLSLEAKSPNASLPYLLITGPKSKLCQGNGLPAKSEIDELEEILNTTGTFITGLTPKVLAGTLTYNCERVNYYYVKDTIGLSFAIARMYNHNYKDYKYVYKMKHDPEWNVYRDFLYPNEESMTWMENEKIITELISQGDSLTKPRDITFEIIFITEDDRKNFMSFAHSNDYQVVELDHIKNLDTPYGIKISRKELIKSDVIAELTTTVKKEAKKYNGKYMGWTSPVVK
ncbi:MAG: DUF695 domain-containing protein [Flavipsychrobacter sp.]|nr:DUF695 domain-containing protein [Flavipsychrobacter sp.]